MWCFLTARRPFGILMLKRSMLSEEPNYVWFLPWAKLDWFSWFSLATKQPLHLLKATQCFPFSFRSFGHIVRLLFRLGGLAQLSVLTQGNPRNEALRAPLWYHGKGQSNLVRCHSQSFRTVWTLQRPVGLPGFYPLRVGQHVN